jgi:hypothetical protein
MLLTDLSQHAIAGFEAKDTDPAITRLRHHFKKLLDSRRLWS